MNYEPKFKINQEVYLEDDKYYVRGMMAKGSSHPNPDVVYFLSKEYNRPCTSNATDKSEIDECKLISVKDYEDKKIKEAQDFLRSKGLLS